jgi:hypothetical protein
MDGFLVGRGKPSHRCRKKSLAWQIMRSTPKGQSSAFSKLLRGQASDKGASEAVEEEEASDVFPKSRPTRHE